MLLKQERDPSGFKQRVQEMREKEKRRRRMPWLMAAAFAGAFLAMVLGQQAQARLLEIERLPDGSGTRVCLGLAVNGAGIYYCWNVSIPPPPPPPPPPYVPPGDPQAGDAVRPL